MPSERKYPIINEQAHQDYAQNQVKQCSNCQGALSVESVNAAIFDPNDATIVCSACRDQILSVRMGLGATHGVFATSEGDVIRRIPRIDPRGPALSSHNLTRSQDVRSLEDDIDMDTEPISPESPTPIASNPSTSFHRPPTPLAITQTKHTALRIICEAPVHSNHASQIQTHEPHRQGASDVSRPSKSTTSSPDPLIDITRIRIRSRGHHCLYPGASFQGTQKSGRNSYDVNVTIVDVDFASSFLCGYLRIRGLTDDWPELTTYFDAEIIGSRHGFLTQNWGANEQEDMVHWQRFPAFRHVKHELKKPHLTMNDRDRGAVFMRWKERFLVPDHRVQDINGASFAGFYYVCVDFNPQPAAPAVRSAQSMPLTPEMEDCSLPPASSPAKNETPQGVRTRRDSSVRRGVRAPSAGPRSTTPVPTMSGFYFHQNSEPYQQLSLNHVPESTSSSFEFR